MARGAARDRARGAGLHLSAESAALPRKDRVTLSAAASTANGGRTMKCTTCGYETQPGARFCVQCGTTLPAEPVPVAAAAAAAAAPIAPIAPVAAPAPAAAPARPVPSSPSATIPPRMPAGTLPPAAAATAPPVAPPVPVTAGPPKLGMIAAMLALVAVLAIGGFVAYRMSLSSGGKDATTSTDAGKASEAATAPAPVDGSKDAGAPAAQSSTQAGAGPDAAKDQPAAPGSAAEATKSAATPTTAPAGPLTKAAAAAAAKSRSTAQPPPAAPATAPIPPAAAPATVARTPTPAAAPQPDRWAQMHDAMARCKREDFFRRIGCEQSVGLQYCEGYWGKVPQCPGVPRDSAR